MIEPITPDEAVELKKKRCIPDFVIEAFNFVIALNFVRGCSRFTQEEVVAQILETTDDGLTTNTEEEIYDNNWLNVEEIYEKAGWKVVYDKPGFNESYAATYEFRKRGKRG